MYEVKETTVTIHTCFTLLSLLESYNYDTTWIRHTWNLQGISDVWCAKRCVEVINNEGFKIPDNLLDNEVIQYLKCGNILLVQ